MGNSFTSIEVRWLHGADSLREGSLLLVLFLFPSKHCSLYTLILRLGLKQVMRIWWQSHLLEHLQTYLLFWIVAMFMTFKKGIIISQFSSKTWNWKNIKPRNNLSVTHELVIITGLWTRVILLWMGIQCRQILLKFGGPNSISFTQTDMYM
jgi:hypothetical protein